MAQAAPTASSAAAESAVMVLAQSEAERDVMRRAHSVEQSVRRAFWNDRKSKPANYEWTRAHLAPIRPGIAAMRSWSQAAKMQAEMERRLEDMRRQEREARLIEAMVRRALRAAGLPTDHLGDAPSAAY